MKVLSSGHRDQPGSPARCRRAGGRPITGQPPVCCAKSRNPTTQVAYEPLASSAAMSPGICAAITGNRRQSFRSRPGRGTVELRRALGQVRGLLHLRRASREEHCAAVGVRSGPACACTTGVTTITARAAGRARSRACAPVRAPARVLPCPFPFSRRRSAGSSARGTTSATADRRRKRDRATV